jgi:hypothetical protein
MEFLPLDLKTGARETKEITCQTPYASPKHKSKAGLAPETNSKDA